MTEKNLVAYKKALEQLNKLRDKAQNSKEKDREKRSKKYVIVCGVECYTEEEIRDFYQQEYITFNQYLRLSEKLEKLQAVDVNEMGVYDYLVDILANFINDCVTEISHAEFKNKPREEQISIVEKNIRFFEKRNEMQEENEKF